MILKEFAHTGGFTGNIGHDSHILYTLNAVQVMALFNKLDVLDIDKVATCILPLCSFDEIISSSLDSFYSSVIIIHFCELA